MNASAVDEDMPAAPQKFIFSKPEERKIRRRFIWAALGFDVIAVALIIPLCVGGWVQNGSSVGGIINSEDAHLVTWSAKYQRNESRRESTFAMSWFLSSCCYKETYVESGSGLAGCIHRTPGSPFNLVSIVDDMNIRMADEENLVVPAGLVDVDVREGAFFGPTASDVAGAATVESTRDALASYGIFLAITLGTWLWQLIAKKHKIPLGYSSWRVMTAAQVLALFALLVASGITTAAAYKANRALAKFENVFPYHAIGSSFASMTWCAFLCHLFGSFAYATSVSIWQRLQHAELYPPEPGDERTRGGRTSGQHRSRRHDEPAVHREVDANAPVDDELPPYSRVDPNEGMVDTPQERRDSGNLDGPIELAYLRGNASRRYTPAPAYDSHQFPSDGQRIRREGRINE